jgi:peroxiredoxin
MRNSARISAADFRNLNLLGSVRRFLRREPLAAIRAGERAPAIMLKNLDGHRMCLADALKNGSVLAAFFKVNCTTSQFTFPFLQRMYEMYGGSNFTLWGISQNHPKDTRKFTQQFNIKFPVLIDGKGYPASNRYGLTNSPTLFLILPGGLIQTRCVGFSKVDLETIATEAARMTGKPAIRLFKPEDAVPLWEPD